MQSGTPIRRALITIMTVSVVLLGACSGNTDDLFGAELYSKTCAVCHGSSGEGSAGRPALGPGSNAANLSDEQIRGVIAVGPGAMPSFDRLTAEQINSLVEHLRILQGAPPNGE